MYGRAAKLYKKVNLESASQTEILDQLFHRFDLDVERALMAMENQDVEVRSAEVNHACAIVAELTAALDHGAAPDMCGNLASLYDYVENSLSEGNLNLDPACFKRAQKVMADLRSAFAEAARGAR